MYDVNRKEPKLINVDKRITEVIEMPIIDDIMKQLAVPPVRREEVRESTFSVCQAPGCGKEYPDGFEAQSAWVMFTLNGRTGQWWMHFCSWDHLSDYALAAAQLSDPDELPHGYHRSAGGQLMYKGAPAGPAGAANI